MAHDLAKGLDHLAMYWTKVLAPLTKAIYWWRSLGSSNLMSGFVPDSHLALVFKQKNAAVETWSWASHKCSQNIHKRTTASQEALQASQNKKSKKRRLEPDAHCEHQKISAKHERWEQQHAVQRLNRWILPKGYNVCNKSIRRRRERMGSLFGHQDRDKEERAGASPHEHALCIHKTCNFEARPTHSIVKDAKWMMIPSALVSEFVSTSSQRVRINVRNSSGWCVCSSSVAVYFAKLCF